VAARASATADGAGAFICDMSQQQAADKVDAVPLEVEVACSPTGQQHDVRATRSPRHVNTAGLDANARLPINGRIASATQNRRMALALMVLLRR
jgi:hypothetical protein